MIVLEGFMSRVTEQYQQACQYLAGGVSPRRGSTAPSATPCSSTAPRAAGFGTWTAGNTSTSAAATARRCWATATARAPGRRARCWHAARPAPTRTSCTRELARLLCETIPCCERVRFTGSGTEATHALPAPGPGLHRPLETPQVRGQLPRLPRPGDVRHRHARRPPRPRGRADRSTPARPACPPGWTATSSSCRTTAPTCWKPRFAGTAAELAAVICEPIYYNAGCIVPTPEFLDAAAPADARARRAADLRRSAQRLPHGARRRAGISRRHARPVHAGQGGRRRLSAERLRRPRATSWTG